MHVMQILQSTQHFPIYFFSLVTTKAKRKSLYLWPMDAFQINWSPLKDWGRMVSVCFFQLFFPSFVIKPWCHQLAFLLQILQHHGSQNNHWTWTHKAIALRMASKFLLTRLLIWQAKNQDPSKCALSKAVFAFIRFVCMNLLVALLTPDYLTL